MSDRDLRALERRALATGDPDDQARLERARERASGRLNAFLGWNSDTTINGYMLGTFPPVCGDRLAIELPYHPIRPGSLALRVRAPGGAVDEADLLLARDNTVGGIHTNLENARRVGSVDYLTGALELSAHAPLPGGGLLPATWLLLGSWAYDLDSRRDA